jgi:membrane protein
VLVTVLGMVLQGNPELQEWIKSSALANFPVIGPEIDHNVRALVGSGVTVAIGVAVAL